MRKAPQNNLDYDENKDEEGYFTFSTDSALLSELGERLVADPSVALTELIKNTYDADSAVCTIMINQNEILIEDFGTGMSNNDFASKWMRIATSNKQAHVYSKQYKRLMTGSKGIGRFSARFLGNILEVESITKQKDGYFKLEVAFDWNQIDQTRDIKEIEIGYKYFKIDNPINIKTGTKLTIKGLKYSREDLNSKSIKTDILKVVSPHLSLIPKDKYFTENTAKEKLSDPGFEVTIIGMEDDDEIQDLSKEVLDFYEVRATISINENEIEVEVFNWSIDKGYQNTRIYKDTFPFKNSIGSKVYADIRYFPRRKDMFSGLNVNGVKAYQWVKDNCGVSIFDKMFRIVPYGNEEDDWLYLDADNARSRRDWRSDLTLKYFQIPDDIKSSTKHTPALYLPTTRQIIGAVFVKTDSTNPSHDILSQSMDRSGFLDNTGFKDLVTGIRFGLELIAIFDKEEQLKREAYEIEQHKKQVRNEITHVIHEINASNTLTKEDKNRIIKSYQHFSDNINEIEEYERKAKENIEVMGLLGTVAGFMTHEYESTIFDLQRAVDLINSYKDVPKELQEIAKSLQNSINKFNGYISYTNLFIRNINSNSVQLIPFKVKAAIKYVISTFKDFRKERDIDVDITNIDEDLWSPPMQVSIFHGIIHNLYTNALKALISTDNDNKQIKISAFNTDKWLIINVSDNGHGIPEGIQNRIWDPLFTTTSTKNNPIGSGMGLGLPLLKKVVEALKGKILISKSEEGFNTTFTVMLQIKKDNNG
ncbi:MAG: sensor histidine kinase [Sulfuricurvum sp.]